MASMVFHGFRQIKETGKIKLFKSCNPEYKDGEQLRDFVYVKDICSVITWLLDNDNISGLFNVGTGKAESFKALAEATFLALDMEPNIEYIQMPEHLKEKYQYYTKAETDKLRSFGYSRDFVPMHDAVTEYVVEYLARNYDIF